ncbi:MAG: hypothetical protein SRB1_00503 [Desulfobacteraceae bacterium Eth-SRB1]|nr:MAG: hypothetical protein SRB1_00503 [Desulfobacteraceae bacterium Eth-SRB1]
MPKLVKLVNTDLSKGFTVFQVAEKHACPPFFWMGWPHEKISETIGLSQNRVSEIVGNTNFSEIDTLFTGRIYTIWGYFKRRTSNIE